MDLSTLLKENARTLYLSAKIMPRRQRQVFTVAYLLCRIADTIADTPLLPLKDRIYFISNYPTLVKTQDKELLAKRIQRAEAQLIIDAYELEDAARQLQEQARNFRERANLLLSAYCDVWKLPNDDEEA